ncbi:MAG: hypothetical protein HOY76_39050 [Streptomyces sp.]|nr:hypothetical protein [Streptomyces sp.]
MAQRVRSYAVQAGRDPAAIGFEARLKLAEVPEAERAGFVSGWRDLGATHLCLSTMGLGLGTVDDHVHVLRSALLELGPLTCD